MAVAVVQGDPVRATAFSGTTAPTLAYASPVTAGNWLVVLVLLAPATTVTSVTDSVNGAWTSTASRDGTTGNLYVYRKENTGAGTPTVTVNLSSSSEGGSFLILELSGAGVLTMGPTAGAGGSTGVANAGSLITTIASSFLLAGFFGNGGDQAAGTSYTLLNPANGWGFETAQYRIVSSTSTYPTAFATDFLDVWDAVAIAISDNVTPPTVALTGTAAASITKTDIVAGAKTVILTVTDDTLVLASLVVTPTLNTGESAESGNNTASASWALSYPNASAGDLLIFCISWDDSTTTTDVTEPAGPNSEVLSEVNATPAVDSNTACRCKVWYTIATGTWTASTLAFVPSATEQWTGAVVRIPAGEFDPTTPIGASTTGASTAVTETAVRSAAFTAGSTDGDGRLFCWTAVNQDPQTLAANWTQHANTDIGIVSGGLFSRNAAVTNSESVALVTVSTIAGDDWCSVSFIVRAPAATTPFADARAAIRDGGDSAQSEAAGWDAKVKPNIPLNNIVRTSDTVITITLQAQADYSITAQETITWTVPATALVLAGAVVAAPTFTIDPAGGGPPAAVIGYQLNYHR